jgi:hypothetical protein
MSLSALTIALAGFACRDIMAPHGPEIPSARRSLGPGIIVVSPSDMHGWSFINDQTGGVCADSTVCRLMTGPAPAPLGTGSAEVTTALSTDGVGLALQGYQGTRLDAITELSYSSYRQTTDAGNNLAIALQFNVDFDLTDPAVGYQGRLVFEPYQGNGGGVPQNTWQTWDAKAGKWWATKSAVPVSGVLTNNSCVQATPCTWAQLLAAFPNAGLHATYGAVILKAGSGWQSFRGNVDNLRIGVNGSATVFDFELQSRQPVPMSPPDSEPSDLRDSTKWVSGEPRYAGFILRDILVLMFRPGTTQADRQAAIDLVNGTVVGGYPVPNTESAYLIRVPSDSTLEPLFQAISKLRELPQVSIAMPDEILIDAPTYRRPTDGSGEKKADWRLNPDSAFGNGGRQSWALEASNAPFAWGCATGGTTRVAVMDMGIHAQGDIVPNVDTTNVLPSDPQFQHGTRVASVLAARGNDSLNMTGMMWRAKLDLFDVATLNGTGVVVKNNEEVSSTGRIIEALNIMSQRRIRVVNISLGRNKRGGGSHTASQNTKRADYGRLFKQAAEYSLVRPLWVLSAGNMGHGTDVYWESTTGIADSLPNETLIVTAAGVSAGQLLGDATGSGSIDLAAPGENVAVMDSSGVSQRSGSSFAAPLVSGTAGLLFDFDSTLTAEQVRIYIKDAAVAGGRMAGSYPLLDAYGALKLAAQRQGAPLCGNRVYANNADLIVQRTPSIVEVLGSMGTFPPGNRWIDVLHGGHRVNVYAYPNRYAFDYAVGGWTRTAVSAFPHAPGEDGGSFNGQSNRTHDADTVFYARLNQNTVEVIVSDTVTYAQQVIGTMQLPTPPNFTSDCDLEEYSASVGGYKCFSFDYDRGRSGHYRPITSAVSPIDGSLYLAIGYQTDSEVGPTAGWSTCGSILVLNPNGNGTNWDNHCRNTRTYIETLDSLRIYRVQKSNGVPVYLATRLNAGPTRMAVSEDGHELLLLYEEASTGGYTWSWTTSAPFTRTETIGPTNAICTAVAMSIVPTSNGLSLVTGATLSQESGLTCQKQGSQFNVPTFAPIKMAQTP